MIDLVSYPARVEGLVNMVKTPPNDCSGYDPKLHLMLRLQS